MHLHPPETREAASASPDGVSDQSFLPRRRVLLRRLAWIAGIAVVVLLLIVTPPLVNANRYRGKIAESMSKSLGRPVHMDAVTMHLLPVPGFTLQNLVVSEDPAFGAEPTIRANTVEASLRVSSLWHHPVEFSSVRFIDPSVNLVRNAQGRWNLSDVLLQASRVPSAPTDQRHAGPTPRFPYIEATNGRVNVKLGAEKLPFSLTEADFALWLPSPQQWRVRLVAHPARTDTNITDPGKLRLEGELRRAETVAAVPVTFTASWHDTPLGEATRILAGDDWGWRGAMNLDASLTGTLGDAHLTSKLTLGGLRRAEFFPAQPLDLQIHCSSRFAVHPATLSEFSCTLPDDAPEPLTLAAETVHLQRLASTDATLKGTSIPVRWALLWAALFSPRVPTDLHPAGMLDVDVSHRGLPLATRPSLPGEVTGRPHAGRGARPIPSALPATLPATWTGTLRMLLPMASDEETTSAAVATPNTLLWELGPPVSGSIWPSLRLAPTLVTSGPGASLTLAGQLSQAGSIFSINGNGAPAALLTPARYLPELGDGLETVLPLPPTGIVPIRVQIRCERTWETAQHCTGPEPLTNRGVSAAAVPPSAGPGGNRPPSLIVPRNLSPLEQAPFSTPRPFTPTAPQ